MKNVWNFYIPVARRTGKEIQEVKDTLIKDKMYIAPHTEIAILTSALLSV